MDHDEVRELLQDAAVEPGGLERIMAGDTPNAAVVAGHLAGCPECTDELERLRRTVGVIRPAVRAVPPPELRQRTLDHVAALGRPRSDGSAEVDSAAAGPAARRRPAALSIRSLAALAAVLVIAVGATGLWVAGSRDGTVRAQAEEIEALGEVAQWTLRVDAQPDVRRIVLANANGSVTTGTLVFSPMSTELVVVAEALPRPAAGREYRCWLEVDGQRKPIGKMFFGGDLAYWVGAVPAVAGLAGTVRFGVSLVDVGGSGAPGQTVLEGDG